MEILLVFVLIWLVCGVLTAVVASSKNRDPAGWGLVGILTGVLGLLAIAGMPANTAPPKPREPVQYGPRKSSKRTRSDDDVVLALILFALAAAAVSWVAPWLLGG